LSFESPWKLLHALIESDGNSFLRIIKFHVEFLDKLSSVLRKLKKKRKLFLRMENCFLVLDGRLWWILWLIDMKKTNSHFFVCLFVYPSAGLPVCSFIRLFVKIIKKLQQTKSNPIKISQPNPTPLNQDEKLIFILKCKWKFPTHNFPPPKAIEFHEEKFLIFFPPLCFYVDQNQTQ